MHSNSDSARLSYEQQLELVRGLIAENARLRAENARLRVEIEQLKRQQARSAAPFSKNKRKQDPRPPGRKPGQGEFRPRPAPAAQDYSGPPVEVAVNETVCPDCGGELLAEGEEVVTTTELPPVPKPEVKAYRIKIRSCCQCQRKVRGRHPEVAPDQFGATAHRVGPRAQAAAHLLYYGDGIPQRKVPQVLKSLTGLLVTQGALAQAALRLGTGAGAIAQVYEQLREEIQGQEAINTDDTGWRVNGQGAQLMVFESQAITLYQIRAQHRNEEVREVIGDEYPGTLCTDRGKSYDAQELVATKQQKCLAHILRSIDDVLARKRGPARVFGAELKAQLQDAIALYRAFHDPEQKLRAYERCVRALERKVSYHLRPRALQDPDNHRLLKEIGRHHARGNLLRFLHDPTTVAPTNNAAERALRPAVIARKVSQCSKTERGAAAYAAFKSVLGTLKKSGGNILEKLTRLLDPSPPPVTASAATP
jgi:transposase